MEESRSPQRGSEVIVIRSADDAWRLLEEIEAGREFSPGLELRFDGWPVFEMRVQGKDWDSTVPTRVMTPLLEIQKDLYRTLMQIRHGHASLRRLTDEDRELLELVVRVGKGSSDYKAPLYDSLTELAKQAINKMESKDLARTLMCVALVYGAVEINKDWVGARQKAVQGDQHVALQVALSEQETTRMKVFAAAVKQAPVAEEVKADHEASKSRLLKVVEADRYDPLTGRIVTRL